MTGTISSHLKIAASDKQLQATILISSITDAPTLSSRFVVDVDVEILFEFDQALNWISR